MTNKYKAALEEIGKLAEGKCILSQTDAFIKVGEIAQKALAPEVKFYRGQLVEMCYNRKGGWGKGIYLECVHGDHPHKVLNADGNRHEYTLCRPDPDAPIMSEWKRRVPPEPYPKHATGIQSTSLWYTVTPKEVLGEE